MQDAHSVWLDDGACDLDTLKRQVDRSTQAEEYPLAAEIENNIPIYSGDELRRHIATETGARAVMAEMNRVFTSGPGIVAVRGGYADTALVDAVTEVFFAAIEEEEAASGTSGDHFAAAGSNSRLWNAHQKLAARAPELYVRYNANDLLRRICQSWLGTGYQITAQVNVVRPGGKAQQVHRDYHMGIQTPDAMAATPAGQHAMVPYLTLQGAVAHTDVPVASGPTRLLPYSQAFVPGYMAVQNDGFRAFFDANFVQLPLAKGDFLFFNPAVFHAAGDNTTADVQRIVNLWQIGSIYGRTMEHVDRRRLTQQVYPSLVQQVDKLTTAEIEALIAATAEAYPFPANLDNDAPLGPNGLTPASQQDVLRQALTERWSAERLNAELDAQHQRRFG